MIGIYKITNLINGKCYIGQSKNIENRFKEHEHHTNYEIGKDIRNLGIENFSFEILEECKEEELDEKEDYYIRLFDTVNNGYNSIYGGQHNTGESNSNSKLTYEEVYEIRESYKNNENQKEVYNKYSDKITFSYFRSLWEGYSWKNIHMDVYSEENKRNHKFVQVSDYSYLNNNRKISEEDIYNIREEYKNHKNKNDVYKKYSNKISESYFLKIWNGVQFPEINSTVYSKENRDFQRKQSISSGNKESKFTYDDVLYFRRKYAYENVSITDLFKEALNNGIECNYNTIHDMIKGRYYKLIPKPPVRFKN